jgi:hypothetical protein
MKTLFLFCLAAFLAEPARWVFEDAKADKLPEAWTAHKTGEGTGSEWKVIADSAAKSGQQVMAQISSAGPETLFNVCVCGELDHQDVDITLSLKAVQGKVDRGGGPVWRFQDENNYYICRWNPLEDNIRLYKVIGGVRTQLATADVKVSPDDWHTIRVEHAGTHIRCYLDEKLHLDVNDAAIKQTGKVGLWTKADAVTHFDDLTVSAL